MDKGMKMKTINYLYDQEVPDGLAVFQDTTNQIRGFSFKQSQINRAKNLEHSNNAGIYFLFNEDEDIKKVYIGQSINGIKRVQDHIESKPFWHRCLLFVTDNSVFGKTDIDYLEYYFIGFFKESDYTLINKNLRTNEPKIGYFEEPSLWKHAENIEFLLASQGVYRHKRNPKKSQDQPIYESAGSKAKLIVEDGEFIILAGSYIEAPSLKHKVWQDNQELLKRKLANIEEMKEAGKLENIKDNQYRLMTDIAFKSPSAAGTFASGWGAVNGWDFWKGLGSDRAKLQDAEHQDKQSSDAFSQGDSNG